MAKRMTDTEKWKKPFIKSLSQEMKLLWFYILDDCDVAGVWQIDLEIAGLRIGSKINYADAAKAFKDQIIEIDNNEKWFVPSFLDFQYGAQLSKTNNVFKSIDKVLKRYDLYKYVAIEITETGTTISSYRNRISQKVRDRIFLESDLTCEYCQEKKSKLELVVDHFIPLKKGGDSSDENLVCSCARCNGHKSDFLPDVFLAKSHGFLNPTEKIKTLLAAYNKLKGANKLNKGAQDQDQEKDQAKDQSKDKDMVANPVLDFIEKNCPNVKKLKQQLEVKQAVVLVAQFGEKKVLDTIMSMENYKPLTSKYQSVYLTANKWLMKDNSGQKLIQHGTKAGDL